MNSMVRDSGLFSFEATDFSRRGAWHGSSRIDNPTSVSVLCTSWPRPVKSPLTNRLESTLGELIKVQYANPRRTMRLTLDQHSLYRISILEGLSWTCLPIGLMRATTAGTCVFVEAGYDSGYWGWESKTICITARSTTELEDVLC